MAQLEEQEWKTPADQDEAQKLLDYFNSGVKKIKDKKSIV